MQLYLQGSISSTYLHEAFTHVAPQSLRTQSSGQYLFTLLGSTPAKVARKMLMKLTPGVQKIAEFNCILQFHKLNFFLISFTMSTIFYFVM